MSEKANTTEGNERKRRPPTRVAERWPGKKEERIERAVKAFQLRVKGKSFRQIALELGVTVSTAFDDIEMVREELKSKALQLAEQEREISLEQLNMAIENVLPFITDENIEIETVIVGQKGVRKITVERYEAVMKGADALQKLIDRKSKLLGMDAPVKTQNMNLNAELPSSEETLKQGQTFWKEYVKTLSASQANRNAKLPQK